MNEDTESKKRFDFVWNTKNGLRKVSDKSLKIGMKLLENSKISITRKRRATSSDIPSRGKNSVGFSQVKKGHVCYSHPPCPAVHLNFQVSMGEGRCLMCHLRAFRK